MVGRACNKRRLADQPQKSAESRSLHGRRSMQFRHTDATGIRVAAPRPSPANAFSCEFPPLSRLIMEGRACNRLPAITFLCHTCDNFRLGRRSVQFMGGGTCGPWKVERADLSRAPCPPTVSTQIMEGRGCNGLAPRKIMEGRRCSLPAIGPESCFPTEGGACTSPSIEGRACNEIPANPQNSAGDSGGEASVSFPYISSSFFVANFEVVGLASLGKKEWPHKRPCFEFPSPSVRAYALTAPHLAADGPNGPSQ